MATATSALATTFTVTSPTDSGSTTVVGTLSWAIAQANGAPGNTIEINLPSGDATITQTAGTSLPAISQPVTITESSNTPITIDGALTGGGPVTWAGAGTLTLAGAGTDLTSGATVSTGGLALGGGKITGLAGAAGAPDSAGGSGETALILTGNPTITSAGIISGGNGGTGGGSIGGLGGIGGVGGSGVSGTDFTLTNNSGGAIFGGNGGAGGNGGGTNGGFGGNGGSGNSGVSGTDFTLANSSGATISGGNGGTAGSGNIGGNGGFGGFGGSGIASAGASTIANSGAIFGGSGGNGGYDADGGGNGGSGGSGVSGSGFTLINNQGGSITGGNGGGGPAGATAGFGGTGGNGGSGITATGSSTITNAGAITGGFGGTGGEGGTGGGGVSGTGFTLTNDSGGTIFGGGGGGNGGSGVSASAFTLTNNQGGIIAGGISGADGSGNGGTGITSTGGSTITNAGTISGGLARGSSTNYADAVALSGGGNTLILESGYQFNGNVVSTSGTTNGDTLELGGSNNASFNVSNLDASLPTNYTGSQYVGFAALVVGGSAIWTVSGANNSQLGWNLNGGTLSIGSAAALGSAAVAFAGGTLQTTASIVAANNLTLGTTGGAIDTAGQSDVFSGVISGQGGLTIADSTGTGSGVVELAGANTYSGTTTITGGTLALGNTANGGIPVGGNLVLDGNTAVATAHGGNLLLGNLNVESGEFGAYGGAYIHAASVNMTGASAALTITGNASTLEAGPLTIGAGAHLDLLQGGILQLNGTGNTNAGIVNVDSASALTGTGSIANTGQIVAVGGAAISTSITNSSSGTIDVSGSGNTLFAGNVANAGNIQISSGSDAIFTGTFSGPGSVTGAGTALFDGTLAPGDPVTEHFAGNVIFKSGNNLIMQIGGTTAGSGYDQLIVNGQVTLGGTLTVQLIDGFTPTAGESFQLIDPPSLTGTFGTLDFASLANGLQWNTSQLDASGILSVTATPEPASLAVLALGGGLALLLRRRSLARWNRRLAAF